MVSIDARQVVATGATSGATFINSGQAQLTRIFGATDVIATTFAFYPAGPGGFLKTKTALATLNLSYNVTTQALTGATATISAARKRNRSASSIAAHRHANSKATRPWSDRATKKSPRELVPHAKRMISRISAPINSVC